jgi:hypothetical protein
MTFYANNLGSQKLEFAEEGVTGSRYVSKVQIAVIITGHPTGDYYTYDQALTASSTSHNITSTWTKVQYHSADRSWHVGPGTGQIWDKTGKHCSATLTSFTVT